MKLLLGRLGGRWNVLLNEAFRAWVSVLVAVPVNILVVPGLNLDQDVGIGFSSLVMIGAFLLVYLALSLVTFLTAPRHALKRWARSQPEGSFAGRYLWLTQPGGGLALYFGIAALITALVVLPRASRIAGPDWSGWVVGMTVAMVFTGWLAVATTYAISYVVAHQKLGPDSLVFPGTEEPLFSDYLYFAIGVTAAFAPPDVSVRSSVIRRRMILQMLIGFAFATVILAAVVGLSLSQLV